MLLPAKQLTRDVGADEVARDRVAAALRQIDPDIAAIDDQAGDGTVPGADGQAVQEDGTLPPVELDLQDRILAQTRTDSCWPRRRAGCNR